MEGGTSLRDVGARVDGSLKDDKKSESSMF